MSQGEGDRVVGLFDELKFRRLAGAMFGNLIKGSVDAGAHIPAVATIGKSMGEQFSTPEDFSARYTPYFESPEKR